MTSPSPPPSPATPHDRACAVPLVELLRAVPSDARYTYTETDGVKATHFIPIGRYAHEAAELIASLQSRLAEVERDAARYRWLRTRINWADHVRHHGELSIAQREWTHVDYRKNPPTDEHIDEYIDAALSAASMDGDKGEGK